MMVVAPLGTLLIAAVARAEAFEWQSATPQSRGMSAQRLEELRDELARRGTTMLIVEQSVNIALHLADEVHFMEKGELVLSRHFVVTPLRGDCEETPLVRSKLAGTIGL